MSRVGPMTRTPSFVRRRCRLHSSGRTARSAAGVPGRYPRLLVAPLAGEAALGARIRVEARVADLGAAVDTRPVLRGDDALLCGDDVAHLLDVAYDLGLGNVAQHGGNRLVSGIAYGADEIGLARLVRARQNLSDFVDEARLPVVETPREISKLQFGQAVHASNDHKRLPLRVDLRQHRSVRRRGAASPDALQPAIDAAADAGR